MVMVTLEMERGFETQRYMLVGSGCEGECDGECDGKDDEGELKW